MYALKCVIPDSVLDLDLLYAETELEGCGNSFERLRKVPRNLNSPGNAAQKFYSESRSLTVVHFFMDGKRLIRNMHAVFVGLGLFHYPPSRKFNLPFLQT